MPRLPPLNAVRVFEVAARKGSYADAATELGITHGAVSRHVATLEKWLGFKLFNRIGRRMVATPMAQAFATEAGRSFGRLAAAAEACGRPGARRILRVSAPASFAMRWLIPRLGRYHEAHADIEVIVTTVSTTLEEFRGGVDVAIRRGHVGRLAWPHHHVVPVLDDVDTLIMSPALFAQKPVLSAQDIEQHTLLASETRPGDWANWLDAAGIPQLAALPRQVFDHFYVTRQAVADGLGIGIGPLPMLGIDMANGTLVTPLPHIQVSRPGYVALLPRDLEGDRSSAGFVKWLAAEGGKGVEPAAAASR